ncbi:MAG TPA: FMN-binding protein [Acidobacteriota bacterium]
MFPKTFTTKAQRTRRILCAHCVFVVLGAAVSAQFQTRTFLKLDEAPAAVFPEANRFEQRQIPSTPLLRRSIQQALGRETPSVWEPYYLTFIAYHNETLLGYAVVCEEIGKHRPITFIAGVTPQAEVKAVSVIAYREPVGDQVRFHGFLSQYQGKTLRDPIRPYQDIVNITGATLSVRAMSRGVRKAIAVVEAAFLGEQATQVSSDVRHGSR